MSKPRIFVNAEIDTLIHAQTIKNAFQNELIGKNIFELHGLDAAQELNGKTIVHADLRFNSDADRNAIRDWILNQLQNHPQIKTWVSKARISWHRCTHDDEDVRDCTTTDFFEWRR